MHLTEHQSVRVSVHILLKRGAEINLTVYSVFSIHVVLATLKLRPEGSVRLLTNR